MVEISREDLIGYLSEGYTVQQIQQAAAKQDQGVSCLPQAVAEFKRMMSSDPALRQKYAAAMKSGVVSGSANSMFGGIDTDNLAKWKLDVSKALERQEHLLRGDKVTYINGQRSWVSGDQIRRPLNDFGVSELMRVLSGYMDNNTMLSNYDEETVKIKCHQIGEELNDLIFMKYQEFGMDTIEKRKAYPIIVRQIVDTIHSTYLRALNGGEQKWLAPMVSVNQNEQTGSGIVNNYGAAQRSRSAINPMRYLKGKYY